MVIACIDDEIDLCGALRSLDCLEHGVDSEVTSGLTLSEIRQIGVDLDVGNGHLSSGCPVEDPADMLITLVTHDSGGSDHRAHVSPGIGDLLEAILIGAMVIACIDDEIDLCSALGRLGLAIDGLEGQVTLVLVRAAPNGDQLFELGIGEAAIVLYTVAGPTDDGQIAVHGGGGSALTRFDNDLGNDGGLVVIDKADINLLLYRGGLLVVRDSIVVLVLGPNSVDSNVGCFESHKAFQRCEIGRSLCCRRGSCISIILQTPSKKSDALIGCIQFRAFIQDSLGTCIVLVGIGNRTSCLVDIIG